MSEQEQVTPEAPEEIQAIVIGMKKDGAVTVRTHIQDLTVFYGLLEVAKEVIRQQISQQKKVDIVKPNHRMMDFLRNGKK